MLLLFNLKYIFVNSVIFALSKLATEHCTSCKWLSLLSPLFEQINLTNYFVDRGNVGHLTNVLCGNKTTRAGSVTGTQLCGCIAQVVKHCAVRDNCFSCPDKSEDLFNLYKYYQNHLINSNHIYSMENPNNTRLLLINLLKRRGERKYQYQPFLQC